MSGTIPSQIYLDYNASTPIDPRVASVMSDAIENAFGNPSSTHWAGAPAHAIVETARQQVADLLGCLSNEIVFTSGGSESNNLALKGLYFAQQRPDAPPRVTEAVRPGDQIEFRVAHVRSADSFARASP